MKTIFDAQVFEETVNRLEGLAPAAARQWGKMSPAQMLEHTARTVDIALGRGKQQQMLLGKLIGWTVRKRFLGAEPFQKNAPTGPDFVVKHEPEFEAAKARLIGLVRELHAKGEAGVEGHVHGFFGAMSGADWGRTQYKHLDHHLRQFGA